jgi:Family of unknown function (DUF6062)
MRIIRWKDRGDGFRHEPRFSAVDNPYARIHPRIGVFCWGFTMSHESAPEKSFTYFALLEALEKPGCPVCRCMADYSRRYLAAFFYEQVNDVGIRRKLRHSRGFCNWHAWQAREVTSNALGVAILAHDLITEEIARLDDLMGEQRMTDVQRPVQHRIAPKSIRTFIRGWQQKAVCPACQVILDHERHALETILNFLDDRDFAHRFERSAPVCVLHTTRLVQTQGSHPGLCKLFELQRDKFAHLVTELDEFCRKHDYRFAHESWGAESDSWLRAIELLAGKPEVLGNGIYLRKLGGGATCGWGTVREWLRRWVLGGLRLR